MSRSQRSTLLTQRSGADDPDHTWGDDTIHAWGHGRHAHSFGQLVHAIAGCAVFTIHDDDGGVLATHAIDDATAIWVPPTVWHSARFEPGFLPSSHALDLDPSEDHVRLLVVDADVRAELLATQWHVDTELALTRTALIAQAHRSTTPPPRPSGRVTRTIVDALDLDPADARDLDAWASTLHTSTASIRRAFKAETGLTWSAWRTQHRLDRAVGLLRSGERPAQAAAAVGFSEAGLAAAVRRHFGCTPSALVVGRGGPMTGVARFGRV